MKTQAKSSARWSYGTLWLSALIWGGAFVFQKLAADQIDPFFFNALRCLVSLLTLLPILVIASIQDEFDFDFLRWNEVKIGCGFGVIVWLALGLQQYAIRTTTVSTVAWISVLYVFFVPLLMQVCFHKQLKIGQIILIPLAILGLLFLTKLDSGWGLQINEWLLLIGAALWALHVCFIAQYRERVRVLPLAAMQMASCSFLSLTTSFLMSESWSVDATINVIPSLVYTGFLSGGLAFTLQVLGQRNINPMLSGIILSLEGVFGSLAGWYFLDERYNLLQFMGMFCIATSIVLSEILANMRIMKSKSEDTY